MKKQTAEKQSAVMLNIGQQKETAAEVKVAVLAVLASSAGDAVKIEAIKALKEGLTNNVAVSNCNFQGA
jgi:hypothetical protein